MSPLTHLLASWTVARASTAHWRDRRCVALAGVLPDLDGFGLVVDLLGPRLGFERTLLYEHYHHFLLHGLAGGLAMALVLTAFARQRMRVFLLALIVFHLHLLCDFLGSRGPSAEDLWPIFYLGPFTKEPMWVWRHQWRLDGWPNQAFTWCLLAGCLTWAVRRGDSFVAVFSRRADEVFVRALRTLVRRVQLALRRRASA